MALITKDGKEMRALGREFIQKMRSKVSRWRASRRMPISEEHEILDNTRAVRGNEGKLPEDLKNGKLPETTVDEKERQAFENLKNGKLPETMDEYSLKTFAAYGLKDRGVCATLIENALCNNFQGECLEFLVGKMADAVSSSDYHSWSHSVCHWFEGPGSGWNEFYPTGRADLIEKLLEASVKGAVAKGELACTARTLNGVILYNLMHINPESLDLPLALPLPPALGNPAFLDLVVREFGLCTAPVKMFASKTQKEFILAMLEEAPQFMRKKTVWMSYPEIKERLMESLAALVPELGAEKAEAYFQALAHDSRITIGSAITNVKNFRAYEKMEGNLWFVDVDGTLIVNGKLNVKLIRWLEGLKSGQVKIVTGGNPADQEKRLTALLKECGVETTIPIRVSSKEELKGKSIRGLIDDTPPQIQGFFASSWWTPEEIMREDEPQ